MNTFNMLGLATFLSITILFFLIRFYPIVFHVVCAILIGGFVHWTGRKLNMDSIGEWTLLTTGLVLYWFGLVIVRVMLTRSVSLRMLSGFDRQEQSVRSEEGIASRLQDATHFGLIVPSEKGYALTFFGRFIASIVAFSYLLLRIR